MSKIKYIWFNYLDFRRITGFLLLVILFSALSQDGFAQAKMTVRGSIRDAATGEAVIGATIVEYDKDQRIIISEPAFRTIYVV